MHIIILILTVVGGAIWWWARSNPQDALHVAKDAATTVRNAPRKIAFKRQLNAHPVEGIEDPRLAVATLAASFIELDSLPTQDTRDALATTLKDTYLLTDDELVEMQSLSRWLMTQCQGAKAAIPRVARKLWKLEKDQSYDTLVTVLKSTISNELSEVQLEALDDIRIAFKK